MTYVDRRAFPLTGCALVVAALLIPVGAEAQSIRVVDPDSTLSFDLPSGWSESTLGNPDASVEMVSAEDDAFLMLIVEPKEDLFGWNMTRYMYVTLGSSMAELDFPEVTKLDHTEIGGAPAVVAEIGGAMGGQRFRFYRAAIDAPGHWIQVVLGSLGSAWTVRRADFEAAVASIELLADREVAVGGN